MRTSAVTIDLAVSTVTGVVGTFSGIETVVGSSAAGDTLVGANAAQTWQVAGAEAGSVGALAFAGIENLTGGTQDDVFVFGAAGSISGTVNGEGGSDKLDFNARTTAVTIDQNASIVSGVVGAFSGIESVKGSQGAGDTLLGANAAQTWQITGANAGSVGDLEFSAIENLSGGASDDAFIFASDAAALTGTIAGGSGIDALDFSARATAVTVDQGASTVNGVVGTFTGIETVAASGAAGDTLIGPNAAQTWQITGAGSGDAGGLGFAGFENLAGGSLADTFVFASTGSIGGTVDGGSGSDALTVNLTDGSDQVVVTGGFVTWSTGGRADVVSVEEARLNLFGGSDGVTVNATAGVPGVLGVHGGDGDDQVTVNLSAGVASAIAVDGGATGQDSLAVNGTSSGDTIAVGAGAVGFDQTSVSMSAIDSLTVAGGAGDDAIVVTGPFAVALTVQGGGQSGDSLAVQLSDAAETLTLTSNQLLVSGQANLSYSGVASLGLATAGGADQVTVAGTHGGSTNVTTGDGADTVAVRATGGALTLNTGASDDTITVGGGNATLEGIGALLGVDAGAGIDVITVDDAGDATNNSGTLGATSLAGFGLAAALGYANVESLEVFLGSGADTITVSSVMSRADFRTVTAVSTGGGDDVVTVTLGTADGFFSLDTEAGNDVVHASASTRSLVVFGGEGVDLIESGSGGDILLGDRGLVDYRDASGTLVTRLGRGLAERNVLAAGAAESSLFDVPGRQTDGLEHAAHAYSLDSAATQSDTIFGNDGDDVLIGGEGGDNLQGGRGNDTLFGDGGNDSLVGGEGDDVLYGGRGDDLLSGEQGSDRYVFAGDHLGSDTIIEAAGSPGADQLDFGGFAGTVSIDLGNAAPQVIDPVHLTLTLPTGGAASEIFVGSANNDVIIGNDLDNVLDGGAGNDLIIGRGGNDTLWGGDGDDVLIGDSRITLTAAGQALPSGITAGRDTLHGGAGNDRLVGDHAFALAVTVTTNLDPWLSLVTITGADDALFGDQGDDELIGDAQVLVSATVDGLVPLHDDGHGHHYGHDRINVSGLIGELRLVAGADTLAGGEGGDRLVGDGVIEVSATVTGPLLTGTGEFVAGAEQWFNSLVDFESLVRDVNAGAGRDRLQGDGGDDSLVGDNVLTVTAAVQGELVIVTPGGAPYTGARLFDTQLVEVDGLAGRAELNGGEDVLSGGTGNDELISDQQLRVTAAIAGPLFSAAPGVQAPGTAQHSQNERPVAFDGLLREVVLGSANDAASGDEGDDRVTGDSDALVTALVQGPMVAGFTAPAGAPAQDIELASFGKLVSHLQAAAGVDLLTGGTGSDLISGDQTVSLAAVIAGSGAGSTLAPAFRLSVEIDGLAGNMVLSAGADTVLGGEGDDDAAGDSRLSAGAVLTGAQPGDGVAVAIESLAGEIVMGGANDRLEGAAGDDRLTGDNEAKLVGVRLEFAAGARAIQIDALVNTLDLGAGRDTMLGADGRDTVTGDQGLLVAGALIDSVGGTVTVDVARLAGTITLGAGDDTLYGDNGDDVLVGDQVAIVAAVADARSSVSTGPATGTLTLNTAELVGKLELKAGRDALYGGAGDDLEIGDSQSLVAALHGTFGGPAAPSLQLTGDRLINEFVTRAENDLMRGGEGNDHMVGDSATTVSGMLSGLKRLVEKLTVSAATDDMSGEVGTNVVEQGNLAAAPATTVKNASISSKGTGTPEAPVIDWNGRLDGQLARPSSQAWQEDFVNRLGRTGQDPNSRIRIRI